MSHPSSSPGKPSTELGPCPVCGTQLELGTVSVHGTAWGFFWVGFSYQHCWFQGADGSEQVALKSGHMREGFRCPQCGLVGMKGEKQTLLSSALGTR